MQAEAEEHLASTKLPQCPTQSSSEGLLSEEIFESSSACDNTGVSRRKKTTADNNVSKQTLNTTKTSTPNYNNYTKEEEVISEPQKVKSVASNSQPLTKQSTKYAPKVISVGKKSTLAELEDELDALLKL